MPGPMTSLVLERMAAAAEEIARAIETNPPVDRASFCDVVQALLQIGTEPVDVARAMKVSVPTVTRWGNGTTSPHDLMVPFGAIALADVARWQAVTWRTAQQVQQDDILQGKENDMERTHASPRTPDWKGDPVFPTMEAILDAFEAGRPVEIVQAGTITPVTALSRGDDLTPTERWIVNDGEIRMNWIVFGGTGDGSSSAHFSTKDLTIRIAPAF